VFGLDDDHDDVFDKTVQFAIQTGLDLPQFRLGKYSAAAREITGLSPAGAGRQLRVRVKDSPPRRIAAG
jgi:hypothetical protein